MELYTQYRMWIGVVGGCGKESAFGVCVHAYACVYMCVRWKIIRRLPGLQESKQMGSKWVEREKGEGWRWKEVEKQVERMEREIETAWLSLENWTHCTISDRECTSNKQSLILLLLFWMLVIIQQFSQPILLTPILCSLRALIMQCFGSSTHCDCHDNEAHKKLRGRKALLHELSTLGYWLALPFKITNFKPPYLVSKPISMPFRRSATMLTGSPT